MNNPEMKFKNLLEKTLTKKTGKFNSQFLFKRLKVKDKDLMDILSDWLNELIQQNKVDLINLGKDKKDEVLFMTKDYFLEKIKNRLLTLDFLLDENSTFSFLTEISETDKPNIDLLVNRIQHFVRPLLKFDKGSRDVPIMFNLFKIFVPERMINISDQMIEKINMSAVSFSESKEVKKMMFKGEKKQQNYSFYQIILTAISYILMEKGKLVLTKKEIVESRGYKVFFNTPNFLALASLIKKLYPFNPYVNEELISFYPENWLDINQIKKQIKTEDPETFLKENFRFLEQEEVLTLIKAFNLNQETNESEIIKPLDEQTKIEQCESNQQRKNIILIDKKLNNEMPSKENSKSMPLKKKKPSKSQPLNFLNEIIYKENENTVLKEPKEKEDFQEKEKKFETVSLLQHINQFDKTEKHFLLCILDSTKVKSGYYSHSRNDALFLKFIDKISYSNLFKFTEEDEKFLVKRNLQISDDQYSNLKTQLEESIMNTEYKNDDQKNILKENNNISSTTENENGLNEAIDEKSNDSLLQDLLIEDNLKTKVSDEQLVNNNMQETKDETLILKNKINTHEEKYFNPAEIDHESFFELSEDTENKKNNEGEDTNSPKNHQDMKNDIPKTRKELEEKKQIEDEAIEEESLDGKIISVLTDNQEKWLKIKALSNELGFELRDGLAYKPEIAVFDEGFSHLEPIARNTGASILHIDEFMRRLGLRDAH